MPSMSRFLLLATAAAISVNAATTAKAATPHKCMDKFVRCQKDATCAGIMLPKSGIVDQTACAKNALCNALYSCLVPCFDKIAACLRNKDCASVYPPTDQTYKDEKDFAHKVAPCIANGLCKEVLKCQGLLDAFTTAAPKATPEKCAAETAACRKEAECKKIMTTQPFDTKACLGNSLCPAYARCHHPCYFEDEACKTDSNCKAVMPRTATPNQKEIEACLTNKDCKALLQCHKIPTKYKAASVQAAWDNHFAAFGDQSLDRIMLDYTETSVLAIYGYPAANEYSGLKYYKGLKEIRDFFEGLFGMLRDTSDLAAPVIEVTDTPHAKQVYLVWLNPASGVRSATDTFIFDNDNKISRQNILWTAGDEKPEYKDRTDEKFPAAKSVVKEDTQYKAASVQAAWDNHFKAFGEGNIVNMMKDYTEQSVLKLFDHGNGILTTAVGRAQIQSAFEGLWATLSDPRGLAVPVVDVTDSVYLVWEVPTSHILSATDTFIFDKNHKILRQNIVITSDRLAYDYKQFAECPSGFWESGCGQAASKVTSKVVCTGWHEEVDNSWPFKDEKCKGQGRTKPQPVVKNCPATPACPRCKGCKRNGDCFRACGKKAGLCAACDSKHGRAGACCLAGSASDPIECRMSEPQLFSGAGKKHTCALLPGDAHVASLIKDVIQRLDTLEGDVKNLRTG